MPVGVLHVLDLIPEDGLAEGVHHGDGVVLVDVDPAQVGHDHLYCNGHGKVVVSMRSEFIKQKIFVIHKGKSNFNVIVPYLLHFRRY